MKVVLFFPLREVHATLPLIPRAGELFTWRGDAEIGDATWLVKEVEWVAGEGIEPSVHLVLARSEKLSELDEDARRLAKKQIRNSDVSYDPTWQA